MIYIVSGFMRSGTSMMMRALEAGGLEAVYNPDRDKMNDQFGDEHYKINDEGFYELSRNEYLNPQFPDNYDGKLVKCLWGGMLHLRGSGTIKNIVFMRRPIEEIADSYEAAFGHRHPAAIPELSEKLDRIQGILEQRMDVRLKVLNYHEVIRDPLTAFESLGWPIDAFKAASVVKPQLYRHRA
jgi:hypothetical protein